MWDARSGYLSNHDGDTVTYVSDLGRWIRHEADIRLLGVYAPELSQPGGKETRDFVAQWHADRVKGLRWPFMVTTALVHAGTPDLSEAKLSLTRFMGTVVSIATGETLNVDVAAYVAAQGFGTGIH